MKAPPVRAGTALFEEPLTQIAAALAGLTYEADTFCDPIEKTVSFWRVHGCVDETRR